MKRTIMLAAGGLVLAVRVAGAQGSCEDVKRYFSKPPKIGEWAELQLDMKKDEGKKPMLSQVAFVDREVRDGEQFYRLQMTMTQKNGQKQILQMLTPWGPEALDKEYDTEVVMKMGDQPAMIMPFKGGKDQPGIADIRKKCGEVNFVGEETVQVPAGSYKTRHYSGPEGDSWMSMDVPGWRMVKMVTKKGDTMVLTATGEGAKNAITEKPRDMRAMMGGRGFPGMKAPKDQAEKEETEQ
ncbi:MAG TPA: hypothetical protein VEB59_10450 [Gemmatimonadales bacterium]|nr:hypothetical protein [Gemmatimonadales bacterium]